MDPNLNVFKPLLSRGYDITILDYDGKSSPDPFTDRRYFNPTVYELISTEK